MTLDEIQRMFSRPGREYGPTPFWGLNDGLDPDRLRTALRDFAGKGWAGVFMHGRTGLEVAYLSEQWWDRIGVIVEECERLGIKAWIYDDYNWPSGPAGGLALEGRPEFLMPYLERAELKFRSGKPAPQIPDNVVAAFAISNTVTNLAEHINNRAFNPPDDFEGDVLLFFEDKVDDNTFATKNAPWIPNATGYLDLMSHEAVDHRDIPRAKRLRPYPETLHAP